jgi:hypothetical protein
VTREQAEREAARRNMETLAQGNLFWIEVERPDGTWDVEQRAPDEERSSKKSSVFQTIIEALTWW